LRYTWRRRSLTLRLDALSRLAADLHEDAKGFATELEEAKRDGIESDATPPTSTDDPPAGVIPMRRRDEGAS